LCEPSNNSRGNDRTLNPGRRKTLDGSIEPGSVIYIRYCDHVLFKDMDSSVYQPWVRETVGWLDYEDETCVRIVWERFSEPNPPGNARTRSTGLAILKKAVLETKRIA